METDMKMIHNSVYPSKYLSLCSCRCGDNGDEDDDDDDGVNDVNE